MMDDDDRVSPMGWKIGWINVHVETVPMVLRATCLLLLTAWELSPLSYEASCAPAYSTDVCGGGSRAGKEGRIIAALSLENVSCRLP